MLALQNLNVSYGNLQVVWDVSLKVKRGEIVALLGLNGAGKTTTLKAIAGILSPLSGSVILNGENVTGVSTYQLVKKGLVFVPEERNLFPAMSVHENLLMGAYIIRNKKQVEENLEYVLSLFPRLAERSNQLAGTLSGGESQMLAIARGLMTRPRMFMLDEPSMGLSPKNVEIVFETIEKLKKEMVTIIIVEQNVNTTLAFSDRAYVMEQGQIMMEGASEKVSRDENVRKLYLGIA
jgi:branched-chain amino acid transport system ATP-binding protein